MAQETSSKAEQIKARMVSLNEAYSSKQLAGYRPLELKDSPNERTTRQLQWTNNIRA